MGYPRVIWKGSGPLPCNKHRFRIVDRGPVRPERPDDVPFTVEKHNGFSMMKLANWGPVPTGAMHEAIYALVHTLGLALTVDLKSLDHEHPLCCEINLAILQKRESRGCDCNAPDDLGK